jgi:uncharacterized protein
MMNIRPFFEHLNVDHIHELATKSLLKNVIKTYQLPIFGIHGVSHWARVLENGMRLATVTGANIKVVILFAIFHDSKRQNEANDKGHGRRGAQLASELQTNWLNISKLEFALLKEACELHTDGLTDGEVTLQTCWDSDRLDLNRVGIRTDPEQLCTQAAKDPSVIKWAMERASSETVPDFVRSIWDFA